MKFEVHSVGKMPDRCAACKSGKKGSDYNGSFHSIPTGEKKSALREKWINAAPFADWVPAKSAKLCELHFAPDDFVTERNDSNSSRNQIRGDRKLRWLKDAAGIS